jgi:hypothetical protein
VRIASARREIRRPAARRSGSAARALDDLQQAQRDLLGVVNADLLAGPERLGDRVTSSICLCARANSIRR